MNENENIKKNKDFESNKKNENKEDLNEENDEESFDKYNSEEESIKDSESENENINENESGKMDIDSKNNEKSNLNENNNLINDELYEIYYENLESKISKKLKEFKENFDDIVNIINLYENYVKYYDFDNNNNNIDTNSNNINTNNKDNNNYLNTQNEIFTIIIKKIFIYIKNNSLDEKIINLISKLNNIFNQKILCLENQEKNKNNFSFNIIENIYLLYEIYSLIFTSSFFIQIPQNFFINSIYKIKIFLENNYNNYFNNFNDESKNKIKIKIDVYIKKILSILILLITNKNLNINFSFNELKEIFYFCFLILKQRIISCSILSIELIIIILEKIEGEDKIFYSKFFENFFEIFSNFFKENSYNYENINNKNKINNFYNSFINFYGSYKIINYNNNNNENNSIFISYISYLFIKFFMFVYNNDNSKFLTNFENFITMLFSFKNNFIIISIIIIIKDLLKIKYNLEFSIVILLLTNFYLSMINIISENNNLDTRINLIILNILHNFFKNFLNDFQQIKNFLLCITKESKCKCFSCDIYNDNLKNEKENNNIFKCFNCGFKTNLILQIIDPLNDDNLNVCGFCNLNSFFEKDNNIFEGQKEFNLINFKNNNNDNNNNNEEEINEKNKVIKMEGNNLYEKFISYQNSLYKNPLLFLKIILLSYIKISNENISKWNKNNINKSFEIFLKIFFNNNNNNKSKEKNMRNNLYEKILKFYNSQKEKFYNLNQDVYICPNTLQYFFFYYYYINFLFAGHYKILCLLINAKNYFFKINLINLKILKNFILFEEKKIIFQNFNINLITPLFNNNSILIREKVFDIFFTLYINKKINSNNFIFILYNNINENSFKIRKKIIQTFSELILNYNEINELKTIFIIFVNIYNNNNESYKIKNLIIDFFYKIFNFNINNNKIDKKIIEYYKNLFTNLIDLTIDILKENCYNNNDLDLIDNNINLNIFSDIFKKINDNLENITNYLFNKFILTTININKESNNLKNNIINKNFITEIQNEKIKCINALILIKIIGKFNKESILIYFEELVDFLIIENFSSKNLNENENSLFKIYEINLNNKIIQLNCDIISIIFEKKNVKNYVIEKLEKNLLNIIINKPSYVMLNALDCYLNLFNKGIFSNKIIILNTKTNNFINNIDNNNNNNIPENIITKSLLLFSYSLYKLNEKDILNIFNNKMNINEINEKFFENLKFFSLNYNSDKNINYINIKTFESLNYFWLKNPDYLLKSKEIIEKIFNNNFGDLNCFEEKNLILTSLIKFLKNINELILKNNKEKNTKNNNNNNKICDYGKIFLFFEKYFPNIFKLIFDNNHVIRLNCIKLIDNVILYGDINLYLILPEIFPLIFDFNNETRFIANNIYFEIFKKNSEKTIFYLLPCLIKSYKFQKKIFVLKKYLNFNIKKINNNLNEINNNNNNENKNEEEFLNTNENIFDYFYHNCRKFKINYEKIFTLKFIEIIKKEFNVDKYNKNNLNEINIENIIKEIEFQNYLFIFICDFHYLSIKNIFKFYLELFNEYETNFYIFKSLLKKLKNEKEEKNFLKIFSYFQNIFYLSFLFLFFQIKYHIFKDETYDLFKIKGFNNIYENLGEKIINTYNEIKIFKLDKMSNIFYDYYYYMKKVFENIKNNNYYEFMNIIKIFINSSIYKIKTTWKNVRKKNMKNIINRVYQDEINNKENKFNLNNDFNVENEDEENVMKESVKKIIKVKNNLNENKSENEKKNKEKDKKTKSENIIKKNRNKTNNKKRRKTNRYEFKDD